MKILLIRHGKTKGNEEHRYIGRTDEFLSAAGREELLAARNRIVRELEPFPASLVFASPMKRCMESARLLFPHAAVRTEAMLSECDFGVFENKNYQELNGRKDYQAWIDSGGRMDFPGGEALADFKRRSIEGFFKCIRSAEDEMCDTAVFVVHGGTIMSVMEALALPSADYYSWQVKNGEGYLCGLVNGRLEIIESNKFKSCAKNMEK